VSRLGQLLRDSRLARDLSLEAVVMKLGYRDHRKGLRKLKCIEATGRVSDEMLVRLAEVLDIDACVIVDLLVSA
jgi:transcriptional regulator with XRE-family HTH domain